jgi:HEAT repeat-containing protein 3
MTTEELGGAKAIYNVWLDVGNQIFQTQQDDATVEASTSLMRATLEHLKNSPELFKQVSEPDLALILNGVSACEKPEIRANWLRMLGSLGCLLVEPLVKKIAEFILDVTLKESDVWTISEALDSFMDMFSENDWNQIVFDLNVIGKSRDLEKTLKTKVRKRRFNILGHLKIKSRRF